MRPIWRYNNGMRKFYVGIDIGTFQVKAVIAAAADNPDLPMQIIGTGTANSKGMRHGYILDRAEATRSIKEALQRASTAAKVRVSSARVSLGGMGLDEIRATGEYPLTASGGIVTEKEMDKAIAESEKRTSGKLTNRTVIHAIPLEYRVDGTRVYGKPLGLQGTKLAVDTLLITMFSQHYDDVIQAVEDAGVEVEGVMASPLAASLVSLTKSQKTAGVCLANIGSETLSIIVFDNDTPVSLKVFPVGSADITNTLALSFQIPLSEAESLKRGGVTQSDIPQKKLQQIVSQRLKDMFTLVNAHLKSIDRAKLLPAGIVITGGGSGLTSAADIARATLKLPSSLAQIGLMARSASIDATWAVAYGLCRWAYAEDAVRSSSVSDIFSSAWDSLKSSIRNLLP
jgi:cell division protein FtsA